MHVNSQIYDIGGPYLYAAVLKRLLHVLFYSCTPGLFSLRPGKAPGDRPRLLACAPWSGHFGPRAVGDTVLCMVCNMAVGYGVMICMLDFPRERLPLSSVLHRKQGKERGYMSTDYIVARIRSSAAMAYAASMYILAGKDSKGINMLSKLPAVGAFPYRPIICLLLPCRLISHYQVWLPEFR